MAETNLSVLIKTMQPVLNEGDYVFCSVGNTDTVHVHDILCFFKERESNTVVIRKEIADKLGLQYSFVASWITLNVFSSLEASGFTAAFSKALAEQNINCNVIAAYYHDHIFVNKEDAEKAMSALKELSATY